MEVSLHHIHFLLHLLLQPLHLVLQVLFVVLEANDLLVQIRNCHRRQVMQGGRQRCRLIKEVITLLLQAGYLLLFARHLFLIVFELFC